MSTRLILVGGFLGAGKTTLLQRAARVLTDQGLKVGLITNDQAPNLVDTTLLTRSGLQVREVNGSCFCCNFQGLLSAVTTLQKSAQADIILAEPVGSCTDLAATIIHPLKAQQQDNLLISPLSVLTDPVKLADILAGGHAGLHESAAYIYRKQLEEADLIVISKTDLLSADQLKQLQQQLAEQYPAATLFPLSSDRGTGVQSWLDAVTSRVDAGQTLAEIDYDIYAEGEAVLGWLNASFTLSGPGNWRSLSETIIAALQQRFSEQQLAIGHVKLITRSGEQALVANFTGSEPTPRIRGQVENSASAVLTLNARVQTSPGQLSRIVREVLTPLTTEVETAAESWDCFSPGRPQPTYRFCEPLAQ